jgi:hypothetical protein
LFWIADVLIAARARLGIRPAMLLELPMTQEHRLSAACPTLSGPRQDQRTDAASSARADWPR